jgi:hypothetical protein
VRVIISVLIFSAGGPSPLPFILKVCSGALGCIQLMAEEVLQCEQQAMR